MPKVSDVDLSRLPKLPATQLKLLWVNDWYDGPLEAVVERGGERLLMVLHGSGPPDVDKPIHWVLFGLSAAQWADEEKWHALFEEHVGHHWCFHHAEVPEPTEPRDPERFYAAHRKRPPVDLTGNAPVGWVDEMPER